MLVWCCLCLVDGCGLLLETGVLWLLFSWWVGGCCLVGGWGGVVPLVLWVGVVMDLLAVLVRVVVVLSCLLLLLWVWLWRWVLGLILVVTV